MNTQQDPEQDQKNPHYMSPKTTFWISLLVLLVSIATLLVVFSIQKQLAHTDADAAVGERPFEEGELLLKFKPGVSEDKRQSTLRGANATIKKEIRQIDWLVLTVPPGAVEQLAKALSHNPNVLAVTPNYISEAIYTPNDPTMPSHHSRIFSRGAWPYSTGTGIKIAIADTGVDASHPDLAGHLVPGWNVILDNSDTVDTHNHGTWVAGAAAAIGNNGIGLAGIAYNAEIIPMKISNNGGSNQALITEAIVKAADLGANVINISFSGLCPAPNSINDAALYGKERQGSGMVTVVAAANDNTRKDGASDNVICVMATTHSDAKASFSNYGTAIDLGAPGVNIETTARGGGYGTISGTSFSAPIVAGVIALMQSANPSLTPGQIETILYATAKDLGVAGKDDIFGYGLVDAAYAVDRVLHGDTPDTTGPSVNITSPIEGAIVYGDVTVRANASDNRFVRSVEFLKTYNGITTPFGTSNIVIAEPYKAWWGSNSSTLNPDPDGAYIITAIATDGSGNQTTSIINVTLDNATDYVSPTVTLTEPPDGSLVPASGNVSVTARATDNRGVRSIEILLNGVLQKTCSTTVDYCLVRINSSLFTLAENIVSARATDTSGRVANAQIRVLRSGSGGGTTTTYECSDLKDNDADNTCDYAGCVIKGKAKLRDLNCSGAQDTSESN